MEKLFLWFNTHTEQYYLKFCRNSGYKIGDYNQYDHLLLDIYEYFEGSLYSILSPVSKHRILANKYADKH